MSSPAETSSPLPVDDPLFPTLAKVLEDWAYLSPAPSQEVVLPPGPSYNLKVALDGPHPGVLGMRCESEFGHLLAECAGGEEASEDASKDAFKELANVFSSHMLTDWWGKDAAPGSPFIPQWVDQAAWPEERPDLTCSVECEGRRLDVFFWGKTPATGKA